MLSYSHRMTSRNAALACLLRQAQWQLDDVAHNLPAGRCRADERARLAATLVQLAQALCDHDQLDNGTEPTTQPRP